MGLLAWPHQRMPTKVQALELPSLIEALHIEGFYAQWNSYFSWSPIDLCVEPMNLLSYPIFFVANNYFHDGAWLLWSSRFFPMPLRSSCCCVNFRGMWKWSSGSRWFLLDLNFFHSTSITTLTGEEALNSGVNIRLDHIHGACWPLKPTNLSPWIPLVSQISKETMLIWIQLRAGQKTVALILHRVMFLFNLEIVWVKHNIL